MVEAHTVPDIALPTNMTERRIIELPIEIQECIIDSLDNFYDAGTIASCALVCRTWLPFSQYKLYSIIELQNSIQWIRFKDLALRSKSESVAGYLGIARELHVSPSDNHSRDKDGKLQVIGWGRGEIRPWGHLVLLQCATRLTGLAHIKFEFMSLSPSHDLAIRSGCYYRSVTSVELRNCACMNAHQLLQFVTAFPALTHLALWKVVFSSTINPPHGSRERLRGRPLTHLVLMRNEDKAMATAIGWFIDAQLVRDLECLAWWPLQIENAEEVWKSFIEAINGPSLRELRCIVPHSWQGGKSSSIRVLSLADV